METLLLDDAQYVEERYEEIEIERKRQNGHSSHHQRDAAGSHRDLHSSRGDPSTKRSFHDEGDDALARVRALSAAWPPTLHEKRLRVMEASLQELTTLTRRAIEEAEKLSDEGDESSEATPVEPSKSIDPALPADETTPKSLEDLPMASQLSLKMFFRLCASLRSAENANGRLLGMIAAKIPVMLDSLPPLSLSPGVVDRSQSSDSGETLSHRPTLSVFHELLNIYGELLNVAEQASDSKSAARQHSDMSHADKANAVMAYVALSLKWGRLRDLVQTMLLLTQNPDILSAQHISQLRKLLSELASAQAEVPSRPLLLQHSSPVGILVSFGKGDHGKLGHGQCTHATCSEGNCTENKNVPTVIASTRDIKFAKVDSLSTHSIAITTKGEVMAWGNGDKYRLGHGTTSKEYAPRIIDSLSLKGKVADVACGLGHTIALMATGDIYAWGNGSNGRLGLGDANDRSSPTKVPVPDESALRSSSSAFRYVMCGASHSLALTSDGRAFTWGKNNQGQCGHGHTNDQLTVAEVKHFREELGERVTHASGGWEHTLFCSASGRIYSCGCGYKDSRRTGIPPVLGHGDCERRLKPSVIQSLVDANEEIVRVSCGWDHSLAVSAEGGLYTWGSGTNGKLGHGDEENCEVPTLVRSLSGKVVKDAKAGCEHTVALTSDHDVWTFGQGDSGRLGLGDTITRKSPTMVEFFGQSGLRPVAIAVGDKYNLVLVEESGSSSRHTSEVSPAKSASPSKFHHLHDGRHGDATPSNRTRRHLSVVEALKRKTTGGPLSQVNFLGSIIKQAVSEADGGQFDQATVVLWIASHLARVSGEYLQQLGEGDVFQTPNSRCSTALLHFGVDASAVTVYRLLKMMEALRVQGSQSSLTLDREKLPVIAVFCLRLLTVNIRYWTQSPLSADRFAEHDVLDRVRDVATAFATDGIDSLLTDRSSRNDRVGELDAAIREEGALILKVGFVLFFPTRAAREELMSDLISSHELRAAGSSLQARSLTAKLCEDSIMGEIVRGYFERSVVHECVFLSKERGVAGKMPLLDSVKDAIEACFISAMKRLKDAKPSPKEGTTILLQLLGVLQGHVFAVASCCMQQVDTAFETKTDVKHSDAWETGPACGCAISWLVTYLAGIFDRSVELLKTLGECTRQGAIIGQDQEAFGVLDMLLLPAIQATSTIVGSAQSGSRSASALDQENTLRFVDLILPLAKALLLVLDELVRQMKTHDDASLASRSWIIQLSDACAALFGHLASGLMRPAISLDAESALRILMGPSHELRQVAPHQASTVTTARMKLIELSDVDSPDQDPTRVRQWQEEREYLLECLEDHVQLEATVSAINRHRQSKTTASQTRFDSNPNLRQLRNCGFVVIAWFSGASTNLREDTANDGTSRCASSSSKMIGAALAMYESTLTVQECGEIDDCTTQERAKQLLGFRSKCFQNLSSSSSLLQWVRVLRDCLVGVSRLRDLEGCLLEHINRPKLVEIGLTTYIDALHSVSSTSIKSVLLQELFNASAAVTPRRALPATMSTSFATAIENLSQCLVSAVAMEEMPAIGKVKALSVWLWLLRNNLVDSSKLCEIIASSGLIGQLGGLLVQDSSFRKPEFLLDQSSVRLLSTPAKEKHQSQQWTQRLQPVEALMAESLHERSLGLVVFEVFSAASQHLLTNGSLRDGAHALLQPPTAQSIGDTIEPTSLRPRSVSRQVEPLPRQLGAVSVSESVMLSFHLLVQSLQRAAQECEKSLKVISPLTESDNIHPAAVFLLASPLSISVARSHVVKTLRIPVPPRKTVHRSTHAVTFWMYLDDDTQASRTSPSESQSSPHPVNLVSFGYMTDRLQESAALAGSNQAVEIEASDRMRLVVFVVEEKSQQGGLQIGYAIDISAEGAQRPQWLTVLSEERVQRRQWIHITVSVDEPRSALYVNGSPSKCRRLPTASSGSDGSMPSDYALGQLNARTQVVCGGSLSETFEEILGISTLQPNEAGSAVGARDTIASVATLIDDLWAYSAPIDAVSSRLLYDQGPTFLQVKQEFEAEQNLLENLRLLHKLLSTMPLDATATATETTNGSESVGSLIELLFRLVQQCPRESAYEVALLAAEVLKQLLPSLPVPEAQRGMLDLAIACFQPTPARSYDLRTQLMKLYAVGSRVGIQPMPIVASQATMNALFTNQRLIKGDFSGSHQAPSQARRLGGHDIVAASAIHLLRKLYTVPVWRQWFLHLPNESAVNVHGLQLTCENPTLATAMPIVIRAGQSELFVNELKLAFRAKSPTLKVVQWMDLSAAWTSCTNNIEEQELAFSMTQWLDESLQLSHFDDATLRQSEARASDVQQVKALVLQVKALRSMAYGAMTRAVDDRGWHASLRGDSTAVATLFDLCALPAARLIHQNLGRGRNQAYKLRSVRLLLESLVGRKARSHGRQSLGVQDEIELLAWELASRLEYQQKVLEEGMTDIEKPTPWRLRQHRPSPLEALGGEVRIRELTVQAVQHFPTVRLGRVAITATTGLWYYEIKVLTDGLMQVGYIDSEFVADAVQGQGVGDQANSWAFDGYRSKKWNVSSAEYGEPWEAGDIVGVLLDTDRLELSYFLNRKFLGIAYSNLPLTSTSMMHPAVSLNAGQRVRFNFGCREDGSAITSLGGAHEPLQLPTLQSPLDQKRLQSVVHAMEEAADELEEIEPADISEDELEISDDDGDEDVAGGNGDGSEDEIDVNDAAEGGQELLPGKLLAETVSIYHRIDRFQPHSLPGSLDAVETESYLANSSYILPNPRIGGDDSHRGESEDDDHEDGHNGAEDSASRQEGLIDGLVNLGFPLSWAVRCAHETAFTSNDSGAVSWILEQMEKEATSSVLRSHSDIARYAQDALEASDFGSSTTPAPRRAQDDISVMTSTTRVIGGDRRTLPLSPTRDGRPHTEQQTRSRDQQLSPERQRPANTSSSRDQSRHANPFLPSEMDDDEDEDVEVDDALKLSSASTRRCYTTSVEKSLRRDLFGGSDDESTNSKGELTQRGATRSTIDEEDLVPACVVVHSLLGLSYTRLIAETLMFDETIDPRLVYPLVLQWITKDRSGICRFLRIQLQLHAREVPVVLSLASAALQTTRIGRGLVKLLKHEVAVRSDTNELPLLQALLNEVRSQTTRATRFMARFRLTKSSRQEESPAKIIECAMNARWTLWLLTMVQHSLVPETSITTAGSSSSGVDIATQSITPKFVEDLTKLAATSCGVYLPWQTAAFHLIKISLSMQTMSHGDDGVAVSPARIVPLEHLAELLAQTLGKDLARSASLSSVTTTLWEIALEHVPPPPLPLAEPATPQLGTGMRLHVEQLASTHATISWTNPEPLAGKAMDTLAGVDTSGDSTVPFTNSHLSLEVVPENDRLTRDHSSSKSTWLLSGLHVGIPSGSLVLRYLAPDSSYTIRLIKSTTHESQGDTSELDTAGSQATSVEVCETQIRTPVEQIFELSSGACGKNLTLSNRNRTVKNLVNKKWHTVRASVAFDEGVHYWHVRIDACVSKNIFIGICTADASLENYIGSDAYGYGFLANKAVWHNKSKLQSYGEIFKQGDLIQVALDCNARTLSYSRNGEFLGVAATNLHVGGSTSDAGGSASGQAGHKWYPAVSLYNKDDQLTIIVPLSMSSSTAISSRQQPHFASVIELVDSARFAIAFSQLSPLPFMGSAFQVWQKWKSTELCWREVALCDIIQIDASHDTASTTFGLGPGDSIFTSRGHCVVLGVAKHELWYEVLNGPDNSSGDKVLSVGSWSLRTCREMMASPEEYPVHRSRRHRATINAGDEKNTDGNDEGVHAEAETSASQLPATYPEMIKRTFAEVERVLADEKLDVGLLSLVDALVCHRGLGSPHQLSFADISSAFVLHDIVDAFQAALVLPENRQLTHEELLMRLAVLFDLNHRIYRLIRLFLVPDSGSTARWQHSLSLLYDSADRSPSTEEPRTRVQAAARLAASIGISCESIRLPKTASTQGDTVLRRHDVVRFMCARLFASQREKLISGAIHRTVTPTLTLSSADSKASDLGVDESSQSEPKDMLRVEIQAPPAARAHDLPFWKQELLSPRVWLMPQSKELWKSTRFAQLSRQLMSVAPHELRREYVASADVLGISRTFHFGQSESGETNIGSSSSDAPTDQVSQYLKLLDDIFTEIQSPAFPLFVPVVSPLPVSPSDSDEWDEPSHHLQLDVNAHLLLPEYAAACGVHGDDTLLWFFQVGQLLGVVWRSRSIVTLQFIRQSFWETLLQDNGDEDNSVLARSEEDRLRTGRSMAMRAVRDGLCSVIPFECLQLSTAETLGSRLSDTDVFAIKTLHQHAIFDPDASHHRFFWGVVDSFSSLERRVLIQFLRGKPCASAGFDDWSDDPIETWKRRLQSVGPPRREELTLELAEPLPDALAHPDACFPVVDVVQLHVTRLHLPEYSSAAVLRQKLVFAMLHQLQ